MTEGQIPAGWYDDGRGQLRWYDGTAWTEHVQPLPAPSAPPAEAPAAQAPTDAGAAAAQTAAPAQGGQAGQAAATPAAAASAPGAPAAGGAPSNGTSSSFITPVAEGETWEQPAATAPIYRKPWFLVLVGLVVLAVIAGIFALASGGDDDNGTGSNATPTTAATSGTTGGGAAGGASFGANAATVAEKAGCTGATPVTATGATGSGPQPSSKVTCTLGSATYTVVTWASAAGQNADGALASAFTQPVTAGTKYYATGEGWTAFDTTYSQEAAQAFATPAGGSVKGVVVVLASPTAAP